MSWLTIAEVGGWIGAVTALSAYALAASEVLKVGVAYHVINLVGATLLTIAALAKEAYPFVALNGIWALVAAVSLVRLAWQQEKAEK